MIARRDEGFTLIELLLVVSIMGFVTAITHVTPRGISWPTLETESRQLHALFDAVRRQAGQQGLPKKIIRSGNNLLVVDWKRAGSGWFASDDVAGNDSFSTQYSLGFNRPDHRSSKYSQRTRGNHGIFADSTEESFIFKPDGSSTGVEISLTSSDADTRYISVSSAGVTAIR